MENSTKVSEIQKEVSFPRTSNNSASVCIFHFLVAVVSAFWWVSVRKACQAATSQRQCCDLVRAFILPDFPVSWQFTNWLPAAVTLDKKIWMNVAMILNMGSYRRLQKGSNGQRVYLWTMGCSVTNLEVECLVQNVSHHGFVGRAGEETNIYRVHSCSYSASLGHQTQEENIRHNCISKLHSAKASL